MGRCVLPFIMSLCACAATASLDPPDFPKAHNVTILALSGSLRRLSSNAALARAAAATSPAVVLGPRLNALPFFDADVEAGPPVPSVVELRALAFEADAFLFATPEYNAATSAVLKNAIDWLSRRGPEGRSPLAGKPYAAMSAGGRSGGMRAQKNLAAVVADSDMTRAGDTVVAVNLFDGSRRFSPETGDLEDAGVRARVENLVKELLAAARAHGSRRDEL